jgi:hypothetical protein
VKVIFKEENCFIPEYNGNAKQPDSEKIKVYWRYPDATEVKDIRGVKNPRMLVGGKKAKAKNIDDTMEIELCIDTLLAVTKLVTRIENLDVNGKRVENGEALVKTAGMNALTEEVSAEILACMDRMKDALKNS